MGLAPRVDRLAIDQLHDQVGHAVVGAAGIEQLGDARMIEAGEHAPLEAEPLDDRGRAPRRQDLDRGPPVELVVVALRREHDAHAAAADFRDQPIGAEPSADQCRGQDVADGVAGGRGRIERGIAVVGPQQLGDGGAGRLVAVRLQPGLALRRRPLPHFLEQRADPGPQTGDHGANPPSRCSWRCIDRHHDRTRHLIRGYPPFGGVESGVVFRRGNSVNKIIDLIPVLDAAEVARVHADVHAARPVWTRRDPVHPFFTLGAASYLDARKGQFAHYQSLARAGNPELAATFGWVHEKLRQAVSAVVRSEARFDDRLALPGFHVHLRDPEQVIPPASIHFDLQFELIDWSQIGVADGREQLSLTLAIALPAEGGGLMVWNINRMEIEAMTDEARRAHMSANRHASRHPYTPGHLAVHSGHQLHQMAPAHDPQPTDERITMQAHALPVDGQWVIYW